MMKKIILGTLIAFSFPTAVFASNPCNGYIADVCTQKYNDCVGSGASEQRCNQEAAQYNASMNAYNSCMSQGQSNCDINLHAASNASNNMDALITQANQPPITVTPGTNTSGLTCIDPNSETGNQVSPDASGKCPSGYEARYNGVATQQTTGNLGYTLLEPLPFLSPSYIQALANGQGNFGDLINAVFRILITIGALIAVGAFVYAGISYMVSEVPGIKINAKHRIWASLWGLLLLLASYVILYTINPQLVAFSGGPNPVNNYYTTPQTAPQNQMQTDAASCQAAGGQLQFYSGSGGSFQNCSALASSKHIPLTRCNDTSSGGVCILSQAAADAARAQQQQQELLNASVTP